MNYRSGLRLSRSLLVIILCAVMVSPALAVVYSKKKDAKTTAGTAPVNSVSYTHSSSLAAFYTGTGSLALSVDGMGTDLPFGTLQVDKPPRGILEKAFLVAASTGYSGYEIRDGDISVDGVRVIWGRTIPNAVGSWNALADVTELLRSKVDASPPGKLTVEIAEVNTESIDGTIVVVVFDTQEPGADNDVSLYFGAQGMEGDGFAIDLSKPIPDYKGDVRLMLGVGISYGLQASVTKEQYTVIEVNGQRVSSSAGGSDDGSPLVGALLTVGGIDDNPGNPADAFAPTVNLTSDDEYYDLTPFVSSGDSRISVSTASPSKDENLFFAGFIAMRGAGTPRAATTTPAIDAAVGAAALGATAVAATAGGGDQILLSASATESKVGSDCRITATLTSGGELVANADVRLQIISGPHAGVETTARTGTDGRATFLYRGLTTGKDLLVAVSDDDGSGVVAGSNVLLHQWVDQAAGARIDITPGVCPSVVNPQMQDLMTVALLGAPGFFVEDVDVESLHIENVAPTQVQYQDASQPADAVDCPCSSAGGDGFLDLVLRFRLADIVGQGGASGQEETRQLTLSGKLKNGTPFQATNCVIVSSTDGPVQLPNDILSPVTTESIDTEN